MFLQEEEETPETLSYTRTEKRSCEDTGRRWPSASWQEGPLPETESSSTSMLDIQPPEM